MPDGFASFRSHRLTAQAITIMGDVCSQFVASIYSLMVKAKLGKNIDDETDEHCNDINSISLLSRVIANKLSGRSDIAIRPEECDVRLLSPMP